MGGRGSSSRRGQGMGRGVMTAPTETLRIEVGDLMSSKQSLFKMKQKLKRGEIDRKTYDETVKSNKKKDERIDAINKELAKRRAFLEPTQKEKAITLEIGGLAREANAPTGYHNAVNSRLKQLASANSSISKNQVNQLINERNKSEKIYQKNAYKKIEQLQRERAKLEEERKNARGKKWWDD